jgi:hypothetical protein
MADLVPVVRALRPLTNEKPALRTPPRARRCRVHCIPPHAEQSRLQRWGGAHSASNGPSGGRPGIPFPPAD